MRTLPLQGLEATGGKCYFPAEHDGQQPWRCCAAAARAGWRRYRRRRAAAMSSRRRSSMGIARVFLGCAKAAPVGRGHKHPHGKK